MSKETVLLFLIALSLFVMQSIGGYFQIKDYRKAIRRMHRMGNVGLGQKKGRFFSGHIAIIACDNNGRITAGEVLDGMTFLSKFHPIEKVIDKKITNHSVEELLEEFRNLDQKRQKYYLGYIRALEALELRLNGEVQKVPVM